MRQLALILAMLAGAICTRPGWWPLAIAFVLTIAAMAMIEDDDNDNHNKEND